MTVREMIDSLKNPSKEFSPIPFWFLNDRLDRTELKRQLEDFNEKGVNGVVLHPRIGLPEDFVYLSEEYFEIIHFIVESAAELDMKIVLYDEAMYPSGSAHGLVVKSNPEFSSVGITLTDNPSDGNVIVKLSGGKYIVSKKCGGTIRGIHFGEDDGENNAPPSADILNGDAVDKFIELTHEQYYKHLSKFFGNTVIGFFTDEPCILGRCAGRYFEWTNGLENDITSAGGELSELEGLFENKPNTTTELYKNIVRQRLNNVYYKKLSDWCGAHNIALMGHPKESDDIDEEMYFHIAGQDLVFRWVSPEKGSVDGVHSVQAKCTSDAARHMKKRRNSNECFGVCSRNEIPWYFTADDMKWYIDWLGVRGVNMFIPHAFYYSIEGKRKDERPPDVGPNNIWWKHYKLFSDYIKRISYIMTDSKNCAKTAVLCKSGDMKPDIARGFYENQKEFNYLPYSLLDKASVKDGKLCIAGYEYEYIVGDTDLNIKNICGADEVVDFDFHTSIPVKELRVSHIMKNGVHMYFVVNEGETTLCFEADMPIDGTPVIFDLWSGEYYGIPYCYDGQRTHINISIGRRESALILFDSENGSYAAQTVGTKINGLDFKLIKEDSLTKTYTAYYEKNDNTGNEYFEAEYEEMAECYVNGEFCSVGFYRRRFNVGRYLRRGKNEIKLVVTGNIANKYSDSYIPFGLRQ